MKWGETMKYALTHCNILNGTENMHVQKDMMVIIEGDKIVAIKESGTVPVGVTELNMEGKYLLPGLINLHAHLPGNGKPKKMKGVSKISELAEKYKPVEQSIQEMVKASLLTQLHSGVTTIRSLGEIAHTDLQNRDLINKKEYVGPRLLVSGYGVTGIEGHMAGSMAVQCDSLEKSRSLVENEVNRGVDWIKIFVTGGVVDAVDSEETAVLKLPLDIATAACEEAHRLGVKVASHAQSKEGVRLSLQAGVDTVEHGSLMDDEIITLYKRNRAAMVVTISPAIAITKLPKKMTKMTKGQQEVSQRLLDYMITGAKQALAHNIPVGIGTDSGCPYITQYDMWREVAYFSTYCEVSKAFALYTATLQNAKILGIDHETGSVEVGKAADLIVVEKNPLEALENLRNVQLVISKGQLITNTKIKYLKKIDRVLDQIGK